jgi:hypothetical protein
MSKINTLNEATGELIDRTLTAKETAQREKDIAKHEAMKQAEADRQTLKAATLAKLGLTADEVAALLS